ncbi:MAG: hypothetical protein Q9215_004306 [Flavoplaca cf. flavocitrina]
MVFGSLQRYSPLTKNEHDVELDPESTTTFLQDESFQSNDDSTKATAWYRPKQLTSSSLTQLIVLVAATLISFSLGYVLRTQSVTASSSWSALDDAIRYRPQKFEPHFVGPPSEYQGQPSPELDAKWYAIAKLRNFAVDQKSLVNAKKTKANVQYPGTSTYQAGIEAFHQLHCLNFIRMYTEKDYYKNTDYDMLAESDEESKTHKGPSLEPDSAPYQYGTIFLLTDDILQITVWRFFANDLCICQTFRFTHTTGKKIMIYRLQTCGPIINA